MNKKKDSGNYWSDFWSDSLSKSNLDDQSQVLRVRNKKPIDDLKWNFTIKDVESHLNLKISDSMLDLCCGNGLFTNAFSSKVNSITAVDISPLLIDRLKRRNLSNVDVILSDVRNIDFKIVSFSKILWYAGIQYLDESDIVNMVFKIREWIKPSGIIMVGDIPDKSKIWDYFNNEERKNTYFQGLSNKQPIIGTWIDKKWINELFLSAGFNNIKIIDQHPDLIYSDFRFDLIAEA